MCALQVSLNTFLTCCKITTEPITAQNVFIFAFAEKTNLLTLYNYIEQLQKLEIGIEKDVLPNLKIDEV